MVYLICFDEKYVRVRHPIGSTEHLDRRLKEHLVGKGARLMEVIHGAGITWRLVSTREGRRTGRAGAQEEEKRRRVTRSQCRAAFAARRREKRKEREEKRAAAARHDSPLGAEGGDR